MAANEPNIELYVATQVKQYTDTLADIVNSPRGRRALIKNPNILFEVAGKLSAVSQSMTVIVLTGTDEKPPPQGGGLSFSAVLQGGIDRALAASTDPVIQAGASAEPLTDVSSPEISNAIKSGPFAGLATVQSTTCKKCGTTKRVWEAREAGWPTPTLCNECGGEKVEHPYLSPPGKLKGYAYARAMGVSHEEAAHLQTEKPLRHNAIREGAFQGYTAMDAVACEKCGKKTKAYLARDAGWPNPSLCDECGGKVEHPSLASSDTIRGAMVVYGLTEEEALAQAAEDRERGTIKFGPLRGLFPRTAVQCRECATTARARDVRTLWPARDLCNECAREPETAEEEEDRSTLSAGVAGEAAERELQAAQPQARQVGRGWHEDEEHEKNLDVPYDYARRIGNLRTRLKMTQKEFAWFVGVHPATVDRWENEHSCPSKAAWNRILWEASGGKGNPPTARMTTEEVSAPPGWDEPKDFDARFPSSGAPGAPLEEGYFGKPRRGAVAYESGPFKGLFGQTRVVCKEPGCGAYAKAAQAKYLWPSPDKCHRHGVVVKQQAPKVDPSNPWSGIANDQDVWCDGCDVKMPAGKVRHLWPLPTLCDHCAAETEPEPTKPPVCPECGEREPMAGALLCAECTAANIDRAVGDYKRQVLHVKGGDGSEAFFSAKEGYEETEVVRRLNVEMQGKHMRFDASGKAHVQDIEVIEIDEKGKPIGGNPLSKKRSTGKKGDANNWREKKQREAARKG